MPKLIGIIIMVCTWWLSMFYIVNTLVVRIPTLSQPTLVTIVTVLLIAFITGCVNIITYYILK